MHPITKWPPLWLRLGVTMLTLSSVRFMDLTLFTARCRMVVAVGSAQVTWAAFVRDVGNAQFVIFCTLGCAENHCHIAAPILVA